MNIGTKLLVALAFIVASFYLLEIALTLSNQGLVGSVFAKSAIAVAALYYAISRIKKTFAPKAQADTECK